MSSTASPVNVSSDAIRSSSCEVAGPARGAKRSTTARHADPRPPRRCAPGDQRCDPAWTLTQDSKPEPPCRGHDGDPIVQSYPPIQAQAGESVRWLSRETPSYFGRWARLGAGRDLRPLGIRCAGRREHAPTVCARASERGSRVACRRSSGGSPASPAATPAVVLHPPCAPVRRWRRRRGAHDGKSGARAR